MLETAIQLAPHHLWQIAVAFALVYCLGLFAWAKRRPHLMLVLWVLFGFKCLTPPIIQTPVSLMESLTPSAISQLSVDNVEQGNYFDVRRESGQTSEASAALPSDFDRLEGGVETSTVSNPISVQKMLVLGWLGGSFVVLLSFIANFLWVRRRIWSGGGDRTDCSREARSQLRELETQIGLPTGGIRLVISDESIGPLAFGFWRPTIVIPIEVIRRGISLRPILTHELCHVWRRDHLLGFLQMAIQVLFWFHPCVWIACRKMNALCEVCCDDDALRIFELNSTSYASGLLDVLSLRKVVRPYRFAPGIRPLEVTKQRLHMIVSSHRSRARRSQVIMTCFFLLLVLPSAGMRHVSDRPLRGANEPSRLETLQLPMSDAEIAESRAQMDFLLGTWDVVGEDGRLQGVSTFRYEDSGNMIREEWTSPSGDTAQGITFYDPNERCWKMTWVDSNGVFMESSGQWDGDLLVLSGQITTEAGDRRRAETELMRKIDGTVRIRMKVEVEGRMTGMSSSTYIPH